MREKERLREKEDERKNKRHTEKQTQRELSDFSCFQSLNYNNVQGPILLIHNGMIPVIQSKLNH